MIPDLKPYPAMKDSGVEWLGAVPEHWEVRRLGQIGRLSKGNGGNKEDEVSLGVPCVRYGDLYTTHTHFILKSRSFVSMAKAEDYTPITFGDVLFAASGETIDEIGKSAVNLMQSEACCGGDVILFRSERQVEARYMGYATDCRPAAAQKATMGRGITVKHVYGDQLKYLTLALPPLPEQSAIVRFLDHADRRIRRYIHAKQKLVKLLEEQKQALIHQIVTRGLDPNVRLKPSGVEWLGDVPEHWEIVQLRRLALDRCDGPFGSGLKSSHYTEEGIRVVRLQNIGHAEFKNSDAAFISPEYYSSLGDHSVVAGDILIAGLGDDNHPAGRACVAPESIIPAMVKADCFRFRLNRTRVEPRFAALQLTATATAASALLSTGATRQRTNLQSTSARAIGIPTVPEQVLIVEHITAKTSGISAAEEFARRQIDFLQEYRTRLIADVVTGKLDVRKAVASLLEEADERDPLDEVVPLADDVVDNLYHRVGRGAGNGK